MFDRSRRQRVWDCAHQERPVREQPDEKVKAFAEYVQSKLPAGARVLDAGCGRGRNTFFLSQVGFAAFGCDLSAVAVAIAKGEFSGLGKPVSFQVADLMVLPYASELFAAVVCVHVLPYHVQAGVAQGIRELWRILRPGGWLYLDLLHCDDPEYGYGQELEEHTFLDPDGVPVHFSSQQEVDELLRDFEIQRMSRVELGSRPRVAWVAWAKKPKLSLLPIRKRASRA